MHLVAEFLDVALVQRLTLSELRYPSVDLLFHYCIVGRVVVVVRSQECNSPTECCRIDRQSHMAIRCPSRMTHDSTTSDAIGTAQA